MIRKILILTTSLFMAITAPAQELQERDFLDQYNRLFNLSDPDSTKAFYELSALLQHIAQRDGNMSRYYALQSNEIVFEANRGRHVNAIKKADVLRESIKGAHGDNAEYYNYVYKALGSIFEHRGNNQMAAYFYEDALEHLDPKHNGKISADVQSLYGNLYTGLARVNVVNNPDVAWRWNEQLKTFCGDNPHFIKPYLTHKAQIYFYKGDWDNFRKAKHEYDEFAKSPNAPKYAYGESRLELMEDIVNGDTDKALRKLDSMSASNITTQDAAMHIHEIMGRKDLALKDAYQRIRLQDSLNNEVIQHNIDELNVAMGMNRLQAETDRKQEFWMAIFIILMAVAFGLLAWRYITRSKYLKQIESYLKQIEKKNKELEVALDRAQESDRMKTTFIQHISHEMRTPLNIITGFVQIVANPDYELSQEERFSSLKAIDENTVAIGNIVNNLLEFSLESSKKRYPLDDNIDVAEFCQYIMNMADERNNTGQVELHLEYNLPEGFTLKSSRSGLEHIVRQVYGNALKFTDQGQITFSVSLDEQSGNVIFAITDTGPGIPEELHEKVFEQFYKIDSFKQGLGIGLTMCRKITKLLGGTLTIDKDYHDGTRMILSIPNNP